MRPAIEQDVVYAPSDPQCPILDVRGRRIDWADQKHDVALRSVTEANKIEHRVIEQAPGALMEWIGQLQLGR